MRAVCRGVRSARRERYMRASARAFHYFITIIIAPLLSLLIITFHFIVFHHHYIYHHDIIIIFIITFMPPLHAILHADGHYYASMPDGARMRGAARRAWQHVCLRSLSLFYAARYVIFRTQQRHIDSAYAPSSS